MNTPGPTGRLRNRSRLFAALVRSLHERTTLMLVVLFCVAVGIMVWHVARLQGNLIESMALANADLYSQALTEFRTLYTREVVERVRHQGIVVTHDYESREGAIPLPATLSMKLGQRIGTHQAGAETRLYSAYPFPWREEQGGLQDRFGREAWEFLTRNPDKPFYRFEEVQGRPSLRYATADLMRASCVDCHNTHPASPKTNWKVRDVRGVLEIIHPMDAIEAETWSGIGETFGLMVLLVLICAGSLGVADIKLRRISAELVQRVEERTAELVEANVKLHRNELHMRTIVDHAADGILTIDEKGIVQSFNRAATDIFGYASEEILGHSISLLVPPTHSAHHDAYLAAYLRTGVAEIVGRRREVVGKRKDGTLVNLALAVSEISLGDRRLFTGLVRDLTERKRAEHTLRLQAQIVENMAEGVCLIRIEDGQIVYANPTYERMFGFDSGELVGKHISIIRAPFDQFMEVAANEILQNFRETGNSSGELYCVKKDGVSFWSHANVSAFPHAEYGEVWVAVQADITDRKRAEEKLQRSEIQLRQAQKMEAIGTLAGGIAHDFNNILGAILGYTELALSRIPHEDRARQNLKEVLAAGTRAKDLVQHILTFSRQQEQEKRPLHLQPVVMEVLQLLRATLPVTIEIKDHLVATIDTILADPTQMHQVLLNLCTNAEHTMRERGGVLEVWLETVEVTDEVVAQHPDLRPGPYVRLTVRDTGQGMALEVRERIFDPFFTTKSVGEGTGMGLAVVHGIVADLRGAIVVDSARGQGTTFAIYIPRIDPFSEDEEVLGDILMKGSGRVLFVDDEGPLVAIGQQVLEGLGYEVEAHTSSTEALAAFRAAPHRYDVVVTDRAMPHLPGEELAWEIMQIRPDLPIILCTGFSYTITAEKARALGIRRFLMKPVLARDLALVVQEVMGEQATKEA